LTCVALLLIAGVAVWIDPLSPFVSIGALVVVGAVMWQAWMWGHKPTEWPGREWE